MPEPSLTRPQRDEHVTFENWEADGCHVFVGTKHMLTLNTPESLNNRESDCCFIEDWISPEEFCDHLAAVLRALGASSARAVGGRAGAAKLPNPSGRSAIAEQ